MPFSSVNDYSFAEWRQMEAAGAVFMPITGVAVSYLTPVYMYVDSPSSGYYWASTAEEYDIPFADHPKDMANMILLKFDK